MHEIACIYLGGILVTFWALALAERDIDGDHSEGLLLAAATALTWPFYWIRCTCWGFDEEGD